MLVFRVLEGIYSVDGSLTNLYGRLHQKLNKIWSESWSTMHSTRYAWFCVFGLFLRNISSSRKFSFLALSIFAKWQCLHRNEKKNYPWGAPSNGRGLIHWPAALVQSHRNTYKWPDRPHATIFTSLVSSGKRKDRNALHRLVAAPNGPRIKLAISPDGLSPDRDSVCSKETQSV